MSYSQKFFLLQLLTTWQSQLVSVMLSKKTHLQEGLRSRGGLINQNNTKHVLLNVCVFFFYFFWLMFSFRFFCSISYEVPNKFPKFGVTLGQLKSILSKVARTDRKKWRWERGLINKKTKYLCICCKKAIIFKRSKNQSRLTYKHKIVLLLLLLRCIDLVNFATYTGWFF